MSSPPASHPTAPRAAACAPAGLESARPRAGAAIESAALLQGGKSVTISHNGESYRLQLTRQGKLILTK